LAQKRIVDSAGDLIVVHAIAVVILLLFCFLADLAACFRDRAPGRRQGGRFLSGYLDPWSGSVCVVTDDRVTPLEITVKSAAKLMKRLGRGSTGTLQQTPAFY
jgi:hypothetical protein